MTVFLGVGWQAAGAAVAGEMAVALAGGLLTKIGPWYYALRKPSWQPPDWLFGPVWTVIFLLTAWSGARGWVHAPSDAAALWIIAAFVANGVLNAAWSYLFFTSRRPDWALLEVVALWCSVIVMMALLADVAPLAAWLLLPYLLWVSFAAFLNLTVVRLNRPFGVEASSRTA